MFGDVRIEVKQVSLDSICHELEACTKPRYYVTDYHLEGQRILLDIHSPL